MKIHAPFAYHSVGCVRSYKFFPKLNNTDRKKNILQILEQRQIKVTAQRIYPLCLLSWVILRQIKFFIVSAFLTLRVVYYISMRRFHRQNVSNTIW